MCMVSDGKNKNKQGSDEIGPTMDLLEHPLVFWKNHEHQIFTWKHMISEEAKHDSYPVLNES